MGILHDSSALGYAGYEPLADYLTLADQGDPSMAPQVQNELVGALEGIDRLYKGLPGRPAFRAVARKLLAPLFANVGWDAKPGEDQNVTLLRGSLLGALSEFDDPAVIAEAKTRFAAYLKDPSNITPETRRTLLGIVARHADAATWDQIHTLAKDAKSTMAKLQLYDLLGSDTDPVLAQRALDLALTDEASVTTRPNIVRSVGEDHPEMAFEFILAHLDLVNSWLEADSRTQYVPNIAANSDDPKMIDKLKAFADAHIPETARGDTIKALSAMTYNAKIRAERLPDVDKWVAAHQAPPPAAH
jgi:aminopeptidase N